MTRLGQTSFVAVLTLASAACGDPAPAPNKTPPTDSKVDTKTDPIKIDPTKAQATGSGGAAADATGGDTSSWETDDELPDLASGGVVDDSGGAATAGTGDEAPAPQGHFGPCKVTWSSGTVARFNYVEGSGGSVEIDTDGNGKKDVCASFETTDDKPTKVSVDAKCDDKPEQVITSKFLADQNLATATVANKGSGKSSKMTLVTLPAFTGVLPGYPMLASKRSIGLTMRDGLIRTANVKKPSEGPKLKATFYYDAAKRIRAIKEDFNVDGSVDQRYDYRYNKEGDLTRIVLSVTGPDGETTKTTGKLDYSCWK